MADNLVVSSRAAVSKTAVKNRPVVDKGQQEFDRLKAVAKRRGGNVNDRQLANIISRKKANIAKDTQLRTSKNSFEQASAKESINNTAVEQKARTNQATGAKEAKSAQDGLTPETRKSISSDPDAGPKLPPAKSEATTPQQAKAILSLVAENLELDGEPFDVESYAKSLHKQPATQPKQTRQVAGKQVAGKQVAGKQVAGKQVAGKQVAGKQVAGKPLTRSSAQMGPQSPQQGRAAGKTPQLTKSPANMGGRNAFTGASTKTGLTQSRAAATAPTASAARMTSFGARDLTKSRKLSDVFFNAGGGLKSDRAWDGMNFNWDAFFNMFIGRSQKDLGEWKKVMRELQRQVDQSELSAHRAGLALLKMRQGFQRRATLDGVGKSVLDFKEKVIEGMVMQELTGSGKETTSAAAEKAMNMRHAATLFAAYKRLGESLKKPDLSPENKEAIEKQREQIKFQLVNSHFVRAENDKQGKAQFALQELEDPLKLEAEISRLNKAAVVVEAETLGGQGLMLPLMLLEQRRDRLAKLQPTMSKELQAVDAKILKQQGLIDDVLSRYSSSDKQFYYAAKARERWARPIQQDMKTARLWVDHGQKVAAKDPKAKKPEDAIGHLGKRAQHYAEDAKRVAQLEKGSPDYAQQSQHLEQERVELMKEINEVKYALSMVTNSYDTSLRTYRPQTEEGNENQVALSIRAYKESKKDFDLESKEGKEEIEDWLDENASQEWLVSKWERNSKDEEGKEKTKEQKEEWMRKEAINSLKSRYQGKRQAALAKYMLVNPAALTKAIGDLKTKQQGLTDPSEQKAVATRLETLEYIQDIRMFSIDGKLQPMPTMGELVPVLEIKTEGDAEKFTKQRDALDPNSDKYKELDMSLNVYALEKNAGDDKRAAYAEAYKKEVAVRGTSTPYAKHLAHRINLEELKNTGKATADGVMAYESMLSFPPPNGIDYAESRSRKLDTIRAAQNIAGREFYSSEEGTKDLFAPRFSRGVKMASEYVETFTKSINDRELAGIVDMWVGQAMGYAQRNRSELNAEMNRARSQTQGMINQMVQLMGLARNVRT